MAGGSSFIIVRCNHILLSNRNDRCLSLGTGNECCGYAPWSFISSSANLIKIVCFQSCLQVFFQILLLSRFGMLCYLHWSFTIRNRFSWGRDLIGQFLLCRHLHCFSFFDDRRLHDNFRWFIDLPNFVWFKRYYRYVAIGGADSQPRTIRGPEMLCKKTASWALESCNECMLWHMERSPTKWRQDDTLNMMSMHPVLEYLSLWTQFTRSENLQNIYGQKVLQIWDICLHHYMSCYLEWSAIQTMQVGEDLYIHLSPRPPHGVMIDISCETMHP